MKIYRLICILAFALAGITVMAQEVEKTSEPVEIDYDLPQKYIVAGVSVEGNHYFNAQQIISLSGLQKGMEVTVPSDDLSSIVSRLWMQRYFEDIALEIDHLSENRDSAYFRIRIQERPRVSRWLFSGVKKGEKKELEERLNLRRGGEYSDYVAKTSTGIIKRYYAEKGFLNCDVDVQVQKDTIIKNAIRVNFAVDKGEKVKIRDINFEGNDGVSDFKLARSMKKTKSKKIYNFFSSKKFNEKEYPNDKQNLISKFNEAGYRDARILKDSIYYVEPNRLGIDFKFDQGKRYYFRNITWTGNSVYTTDQLNEILNISKGEPYDMVTMQKRLFGGGKQTEYGIHLREKQKVKTFYGVLETQFRKYYRMAEVAKGNTGKVLMSILERRLERSARQRPHGHAAAGRAQIAGLPQQRAGRPRAGKVVGDEQDGFSADHGRLPKRMRFKV